MSVVFRETRLLEKNIAQYFTDKTFDTEEKLNL